jgi:hypothetical protein
MKPTQGFEPGEIYTRLNLVMQDVGAVRKNDKNQAQGFKFRGIDAVVNAVYPALCKHGLVIIPSVLEHEYETVTIGAKGTQMGRVSMEVGYAIKAPDGSLVNGSVRAEAMDTGDKATAKCMSVAYRTFLLQTFCLPTDEPDPDHDVYERSTPDTSNLPPRNAEGKRVVHSPRPGKKDEQFHQPTMPTGNALTKAQRMLIERQTADHIGGTLVAVSDVLGRVIQSFDEVDQSEFRTIITGLAPEE